MDVLVKLQELLNERGWTEYKLAKKAGLNESTISNIYRRNTVPTVATLEAICNAFGITMSEFFSENGSSIVELTPQTKELLDAWDASFARATGRASSCSAGFSSELSIREKQADGFRKPSVFLLS